MKSKATKMLWSLFTWAVPVKDCATSLWTFPTVCGEALQSTDVYEVKASSYRHKIDIPDKQAIRPSISGITK